MLRRPSSVGSLQPTPDQRCPPTPNRRILAGWLAGCSRIRLGAGPCSGPYLDGTDGRGAALISRKKYLMGGRRTTTLLRLGGTGYLRGAPTARQTAPEAPSGEVPILARDAAVQLLPNRKPPMCLFLHGPAKPLTSAIAPAGQSRRVSAPNRWPRLAFQVDAAGAMRQPALGQTDQALRTEASAVPDLAARRP
ncbi:hypothetical protein ACCO45_004095 [Purpureocillium lilacinum]|uniref:Uncharacterized protein n=1 Tax=Purpureocillium lilacinum TaxID=33203 RepID=A0ACC4E1T9_PURLI